MTNKTIKFAGRFKQVKENKELKREISKLLYNDSKINKTLEREIKKYSILGREKTILELTKYVCFRIEGYNKIPTKEKEQHVLYALGRKYDHVAREVINSPRTGLNLPSERVGQGPFSFYLWYLRKTN